MEVALIVCLLTLELYVRVGAQDAPLVPLPNVPDHAVSVVFSQDLNHDYTPCRGWLAPCDGGHKCTAQGEYIGYLSGPRPGCPILQDFNFTQPEGTCALLNNECTFSTVAPTCVSWLPDCSTQYRCTTEEVYSNRTTVESTCFRITPPTPDSVCVPVNDSCQWRNPCTIWKGFCEGDGYTCGNEVDFAAFINGPHPICAAPPVFPPNPFEPVIPTPISQPAPVGECLYHNGQCEWSRCRSWLGHCRMHWNCGTEYGFQVFQTLPVPPCANPGPNFVPPIEPGMCEFDIEKGVCDFNGIIECEGGREYQPCGSHCPRTCDNLHSAIICFTLICSAGCFCPEGTVLHNDTCIPPSECPNACDDFECDRERGYECKVFEPTGEAFCSPNCEELNPCKPHEECVIEKVQCVRAPCPDSLDCKNKEVVVFSQDLNPDYAPCRSWIAPCSGVFTCTTQEEYGAHQSGPRPICQILPDSNFTQPEGTCALLNNECTFSAVAPTCVSWLPDCSTQYHCTTEEVYSNRTTVENTCFRITPPTPDSVCVPVNDSCQWHNPCTIWREFCEGDYMCGSKVEFALFLNGPRPICAAPPPIFAPNPFEPNSTTPAPISRPVPVGECLYRNGQCEWSRCRSWLGHCRTHWNCGTEYEFQVFQTLPVPPCANPGPNFVPPIEPGMCEFDIEKGVCDFNGIIECEGGREYQPCGSHCPRTCDNLHSAIICLTLCSAGCFCPEGTVLHNDTCIPPSECPNEGVVFSPDLNPDYTPCRSWIAPCSGVFTCTTQEEYGAHQSGPRPICQILPDFNFTQPEGTCALLNNECTFSAVAPTCVSWLPDCSTQYRCTTEEVYSNRTTEESSCFRVTPPTPDSVCVPVNDSCQWHNPCTIWREFCEGDYMCGSEVEFAVFLNGPRPICAAPPPIFTPNPFEPNPTTPAPISRPVPVGECLYRNGQCEWSRCRSWLGHCQRHWNCGTEYEFQVFQTLPVPPCANPGPNFVPPIEPGMCEFDIEKGVCDFNGIVECEGGREYQPCGSHCPRTCDNLHSAIICITLCSAGCFCPEGTVLHNNTCIPPSKCPNACDDFECDRERGYECKVFEPTGEAFCSPNCEELNPCKPHEECVIEKVQCVRAPCPDSLDCKNKVTVDVQLYGTGLSVNVTVLSGAKSVRVIVRDSTQKRYTKKVIGSPSSVSSWMTFPNLSPGLARVRANVVRTSGERVSTDWETIIVPST